MATQLKASAERVLYLYGLTQSRPGKSVHHLGVDLQTPVEPIECEGMICWTSLVSGEEFGASLARNMENLDWLATASVAHQRAIGAIAQLLDILPARFGTVFHDEKSLAAHIRGHIREINEDFKRIRGAEEWGVKIFQTAPAAIAIPRTRSGKEYLMAKAALLPRKNIPELPQEQLAEFKDALSKVAEESAAPGRISSGQRGLAFQTSLLVKRANRERLQTLLKKFSRKWVETHRIECSGPWPPYSFVSQDSKLQ